MKKHGYSLLDSHVRQHNDFIVDFNAIAKERKFDDTEKSNALVHKILYWFSDHIMTSDKLLANFIICHDIR